MVFASELVPECNDSDQRNRRVGHGQDQYKSLPRPTLFSWHPWMRSPLRAGQPMIRSMRQDRTHDVGATPRPKASRYLWIHLAPTTGPAVSAPRRADGADAFPVRR